MAVGGIGICQSVYGSYGTLTGHVTPLSAPDSVWMKPKKNNITSYQNIYIGFGCVCYLSKRFLYLRLFYKKKIIHR